MAIFPYDLCKRPSVERARLGGKAGFLGLIFVAAFWAAITSAPTPAAAQSTACLNAPGNVTFTLGRQPNTADIAWDVATATGSCTADGYAVHVRLSTGAWDDSDASASTNSFPSGVDGFSATGGASILPSGKSRFDIDTVLVDLERLTVGTSYEARVRAYESSGGTVSAWSSIVSHTATESTVTATPATSDTVTLTWTQTPTGADAYVRWRTAETDRRAAGPWFSSEGADVVDCNAPVPTDCGGDESANYAGLEITGLAPGVEYDFQIVSVVSGTATLWGSARGRALNNDARMEGISTVSGFAREFISMDVRNVFDYTEPVGSTITEVVFQTFTTNLHASILIDPEGADAFTVPRGAFSNAITLGAAGTTTAIVFTITAEDGVTELEYTLNIFRVTGTENTLARLQIFATESAMPDGTFTPAFELDSAVMHYDIAVDASKATARIDTAATDPDATLSITPDANSPLAFGDNAFTIKVTPSDGSSPARTTTLTITRPLPAAVPGKLKLSVTGAGSGPRPFWSISDAPLIASNPYRLRWRRAVEQDFPVNKSSIGVWEPSAEGRALAGAANSMANCMTFVGDADCLFTTIPFADMSEPTAPRAVFEFQIAAVGLYGLGEWSAVGRASTGIATETLNKPTEVAAVGGGELVVSWTAPTGATFTNYSVRWRVGSSGAWQGWVDAPNIDNSPIVGDSDEGVIAGGSDTSHKIPNLTDGTAYDIQVRAHKGTLASPWSDTITATPATGDSDARLSSFGITGLIASGNVDRAILAPAFDPEITEYAFYGSTNSITVAPVVAATGAMVTVTGGSGTGTNQHSSSAYGSRLFTIVVTSKDSKATKTYTIVSELPFRASTLSVTDANGTSLPLSPNQHTGTTRDYVKDYTISTLVTTGSIRVRSNYSPSVFGGTLPNPAPTIGVKGGTAIDLEDDVVTDVVLNRGMNEVQIKFHASNAGAPTPDPITHTIHVYRTEERSSDASLRSLAVEADAASQTTLEIAGGFVKGKTEYDIHITAGDSGEFADLTFTAVPTDATASVTAGTSARTHARAPGIETHTLTVTAEDSTTQDYNFRLIRTANFTALAVKRADGTTDVPIEPTFGDTTFEYTGSVPNQVEALKITPTYDTLAPNRLWRLNGGSTTATTSTTVITVSGLVVGENEIEFLFSGPASGTKPHVIYTLTIDRAAPPPPSTTIPAASTFSPRETVIELEWNGATGDPTGYRVRWREESVSPVAWMPNAQGQDVGNTVIYDIRSLKGGTSYIYEVQAYNAGGASAWTAGATAATTLAVEPVSFALSTFSHSEGSSSAVGVVVEIPTASTAALPISFTVGGTATVTDDYTISASPINIPANEKQATIDITLVNDTLPENDETIILTLVDGEGYSLGATKVHTLTINDDDVPAQISGVGSASASSDDTFVWLAWNPPAGVLLANPYEIRYRVFDPLTRWRPFIGAEIVTESGGASCTDMNIYDLLANCLQAKLPNLVGPGVEYEFQVRAQSRIGFGDWSLAAAVTNSGTKASAAAAPTAFTATAAAGGATLAWTAPAGTILDYRVRYRTAALDPDGTPGNSDDVAEGDWQGWIDVTNLDNSPVLGPDVGNGFAIGQTTSPYILTGLTDGTLYDVNIAAIVSEVVGTWAEATVTPTAITDPPGAPPTQNPTLITSTGFTMNWERVAAAENYHVRWRAVGGAWQNASGADTECNDNDATNDGDCGEELGSDVSAYAITGLSAGTNYDYAVRASNTIGTSGWASLSAQTLPTVSFTAATSEVTEGAGTTNIEVTLTGASATELMLNFTSAGATGHTLPASPLTIPANATTANITVTIANDSTAEVPETLTITLAAGTGYELAAARTEHVLTINDDDRPAKISATEGGMGGNTNHILAVWNVPTGTLLDDPYEVRWRVKSPLGVWASKKGSALTTTNPSDCVATYNLLATCRQAQLDGLTGPGVTYEFQVRAQSTGGAGEWSDLQEQANSGTAATPAALAGLAGASAPNAIALTWTAPATAPADYRLRYRTAETSQGAGDEGAWQGWVNDPTAEETTAPTMGDNDDGFAIGQTTVGYELAGLMGGVAYNVALAAVVGEVLGAWAQTSVTAGAPTERPAAPAAPTATEINVTSFTANWTKVAGATNYHVRWRARPNGAWQPEDDGEDVANVAAYTITKIRHSTAYDFAVRASNDIGSSAWVQSAAPATTPFAESDATLTGLTVTGDGTPMRYPTAFETGRSKYNIGVDRATSGNYTLTFVPALPANATASGALAMDSTGTLADSGADRVTGNAVTFDGNALGVETYTLTVLAEDGVTKRDYVFQIIVGPDIMEFEILDATEGGTEMDIPLGDFDRNRLLYSATVPNEIAAVEVKGTWTKDGPSATIGIRDDPMPQDVTVNSGATGNTIALATGVNMIDLVFANSNAGKTATTYTFTITREATASTKEKAEAVAKSVTAAVVLSGVLDAVSQNAFDATGSFTPFVNVGARAEQGTRQAFVPAAAPLLLSEQPVRRNADWRDLLGASAFRLQLTPAEAWNNTTEVFANASGAIGEFMNGGEWSVWGSGDVRGFNGGGNVKTEGMGYSGYLGTDYKKGNWLVGIAAGYSTTTADITVEEETTKSEFWLAGGYPYLRYSWQNRIDAWLLLGAGAGELMLKEEEADATALVVSHLYAAGAKANVLQYGNISLAAKVDVAANFAQSVSTNENLEDFATMQQRARVGLDLAYNYRIATHAIRPHLEVGARLDFGAGGDIAVGDTDLIPGAEVAGGVRYEYLPLRISVDARGRALVYDTTGLLREWGAGATIRVTPRAGGEGVSASLTPGWGTPQSRIDNMWQHETPTLTQSQNITQALSLRGELAYTFKHKDARITPLTQYSLNAQSQTIGLGTRFNLAPLSLELLGERVDYNTITPDNYRLRLQGSLRF